MKKKLTKPQKVQLLRRNLDEMRGCYNEIEHYLEEIEIAHKRMYFYLKDMGKAFDIKPKNNCLDIECKAKHGYWGSGYCEHEV